MAASIGGAVVEENQVPNLDSDESETTLDDLRRDRGYPNGVENPGCNPRFPKSLASQII